MNLFHTWLRRLARFISLPRPATRAGARLQSGRIVWSSEEPQWAGPQEAETRLFCRALQHRRAHAPLPGRSQAKAGRARFSARSPKARPQSARGWNRVISLKDSPPAPKRGDDTFIHTPFNLARLHPQHRRPPNRWGRTLVLFLLASLSLWAAAPSACAAAELKNSYCLDCHSDKTLSITNSAGRAISLFIDEAKLADSVHKTNTCASCHSDIKSDHPDDHVVPKPVDCARCHDQQAATYEASVHGLARRSGEPSAPNCADCHGNHQVSPPASPSSPLYFANLTKTCGECHPVEAEDVGQSVHGKAVAAGRREAATCTDCHAEHKIEGLKKSSSLAISQDVCGKCHSSERINAKFNLPSDRVKTFLESYHGLAAQKTGTLAANCSSCHGFHKILRSSDPNSTINTAHLVETCGKCHPGSNENFAQARVHVDLAYAQSGTNLGDKINHWVRRLYLGLIFAVIGGMLIHNVLLFARKMAVRAQLTHRTVVRMDKSQRLQHATLAISFILLAWTGFALKFPDSWIGHFLISNEAVRSWTHRIAGVIMLLGGAWHIGYVLGTVEGWRLVRDMFPARKDLADVTGAARYLAGLQKHRPKTARFGYAEKMEYWAVVWGTIIMGATGLMIWFKMDVTRWLQRWVVDVATNVHYYEAVLACLAIVVWHFYHVIFDPDVYPLNRACLDGKVSQEWMEEEHPLDTKALLTRKPSARTDETAPHRDK